MKSIFKKATLVLLMFGLVFALFGCKKNDAKALENYLLKQDAKVVSEDFVLDGTLSFNDKEYELTWTSNNNAIQIEKRDNDYLAKVNYPDQETAVTLTVKLGKATKEFTVTVLPIDVYNFSQTYVFPKDKQTVTESFDLDTTCTYAGKTATITWSVDESYKDYVDISEDGARCLVSPSSLNPEVKIKATFTYNGETTTKQYRMTVAQELTDEERVDYWYSNTGISQVISGYVVAKGNWKEYNGVYEALLCVIDDSGLCGYYLYLEPTDMNKEAFAALQIGAHVTNTGSVNTNYNGLQETTNYKGKTVLDDDIEVKQIVPFAIDNDLIAGGPVATYMTSTLVSLTNWEVKKVEEWSQSGSTNTIMTLTKGGLDIEILTSKYFLLEPDSIATDTTVMPAIRESVKDIKAGDFVNVKGILSYYKNKAQIIAHAADSITMGVADTTATADLPGTLVKEVMTTNKGKFPKGLVTSNTTIEFAASTDKVTVKYELLSSSNALSVTGNTLTITPSKAESATVKITYTCGDWSTYELVKIKSQKVSEAEMVAAELAKITNFNVDKTTELASKGEVYEDVAISWALKEASEGVTIENSKLVVAGGLDKDVVLVATLTAGEASETKEVTVHVTTPDLGHNGTPTDPLDAKTAIVMAGQLDATKNEVSEYKYFVKATIVDDPTADYCNFNFQDGDKKIVVYGLWAPNGTDRYGTSRQISELPVKKGDEVVLYANLQNYNNKLELVNAILVSVNGEDKGAQIKLSAREAALIASELDGAAKQKTEGKYYFEVTITDDPTAEYCNFHFKSGETELLVYGLYAENGTDRYGSKREIAELPVKKGDKVVLFAKVQNYQGTYQLADAVLVSVDKPVVIEHAGTEADPFTVSDAILKTEQETGKKDNTYTAAKYYVTGVVKSVKYYDIKDSSGTVIGKDATIELQEGNKVVKASYTLTPESLDTIYAGDTVTAYGYLQYYSGNSSLYPKDKNNSETGEWPVATNVVHGTSTVTVATESSEHATVKDLSAESGTNGSTFTFKVEAAENYVIDAVKVNGKELEAVEGVYTATIAGPTTILVVASEATATEKTIEIDLSQTIEGIPQGKSGRHSGSSIEITVGGITFDLRNAYQSSYNGETYVMLASATTDADADGVSGANAKQPAWFANKTAIPGRIISITVYGREGSSPAAVYYLDAFETVKTEALATSTTTVTGLTTEPLVYTAAEGSNLYYFNLSTTTAKNGQITKIVIVYEPGEVPTPVDTTKPEITISDSVLQALSTKEFWEGADEQATFAAFMQGISATDDTDGTIAVTQSMVNLGGLTPANLVAGDYTITITVTDAAGNEAKKEVNIHVKKYAMVDLLADMPTPNADYKSPNWKVEKYTTDWTVQTDVQMRARKSSAGAVVTNMANGYGMTMRFTYSTGASLGVANSLSFKMGNYWSDKAEMSIKIKLVTVDDKEIYVLGSSSEFYAFHTTTDVEDFNLTFNAAEIKAVVFVTKSALQKNTYLYVGSIKLAYEEPASSPATFQLANLQAEGNARNHIEGAGAWIWIDPTSIGLTAENMAQFSATATCESLNVVEAFFSDYSASAVRCYVKLASAPAADATTTIHLTITNGDASYQGQVSFLGNELQ